MAARKAGSVVLAVAVVLLGEVVAAGGRAVACLLVTKSPAALPCIVVALSSFLLNPEMRGLIQTPHGESPWLHAPAKHHP